ncbi:hypothetical protein PC110_g6007 [Phytophthora cactorum]|uniref:DDE-1 domain-containing protein n=1 Tax=Phytophthora cactorum TaxID=29920 RepID=A0A329SLZ4_9STRA|nr:hypothetical protein PC110_g6007 [Phytophthora cactorum]
MLVFLPPNATHLLQPLDVAVFATLKNKMRKLMDELVEEDDEGYFTITMDDAIKVSSLAWKAPYGPEHRERIQGLWTVPALAGEDEGTTGDVQAQWTATSCSTSDLAENEDDR